MNKNKIFIIVGSILSVIILTIIILLITNKKPITYNVSFETDGGSFVETQVVKKNDTVTKPINPLKDGYVFDEWTYLGKTYDFNQKVTSDLKLVAKWTKLDENIETFKIKFDADGGTNVSEQIVIKGNKVEKPADPTKEGYVFTGWTLNDEIYDFNKIVEKDLELKAKWEKVVNNTTNPGNNKNSNKNNDNNNNNNNNNNNKPSIPQKKTFTVTFNSNGGSAVSSQTVEEGNKASKPNNPTRNGYNFAGWLLNGKAYDFNLAVNGNITLEASWTEIKKNNYTITFNSNGGSAVSSQTVVEGNKASKPSNPTRSGYNFAGWLLNGKTYDFNSAVNGNITLIANWVQKSYTIVATRVDAYSPDSVLTVYEDGKKISVKTIKYSDGTYLCSGTNTTVYTADIAGESNFIIILNDGTQVLAKLQ